MPRHAATETPPLSRGTIFREDVETFPGRRPPQSIVERDEAAAGRPAPGPEKRSGELKRVGGSKRVHREQALGAFAETPARGRSRLEVGVGNVEDAAVQQFLRVGPTGAPDAAIAATILVHQGDAGAGCSVQVLQNLGSGLTRLSSNPLAGNEAAELPDPELPGLGPLPILPPIEPIADRPVW